MLVPKSVTPKTLSTVQSTWPVVIEGDNMVFLDEHAVAGKIW